MHGNDPDKEWLAQRYDMLASKFLEYYQAGKTHGREAMALALDEARAQLTSLGEFSVEQGDQLTEYLMRDLEQTMSDVHQWGDKSRLWLHPARVGAGALASLASLLEHAGSALQTLSAKTTQALTYKTGEITSAGSLTCQACGQKLHLKKTGHVPPCPKCGGTQFHKSY